MEFAVVAEDDAARRRWSLHTALVEPRVVGALMVNLYAFQWSEELVAERETAQSLGALRGARRAWRKLRARPAAPAEA